MKNLWSCITALLLCTYYLSAQEQHIYGPAKENYFETWLKENSDTPYKITWDEVHEVGFTFITGGGTGELRNINYWTWQYSDIPTEATVTSVTVRFRTQYSYDEDFIFSLHDIPYPHNASGINFYNECNVDTKIHEQTLTRQAGGWYYFNETFTSGDLFDAIQDAVTSGNYYFTLGIKFSGPDMEWPYWHIYPYNDGYVGDKSVDITVNYTTPDQYYSFVNKIEGTQNFGSLIVDNDKVHPVASNSAPRMFSFNTNHTVRTNELPFAVNWNGTGKTEKHHHFYPSDFDYSLNHPFTSIPTVPSVQDANFVETKPVTITNQLLDGGSGSAGNVELKDPWRYYSDANNDWFQSNQFISYAAPFAIQNNSTNSYGGVFLNENQTFDPTRPNYSVNAPSPQTINGLTSYFQNWSGSNVTFQDANAQQTGVVFNSAGATVTATYKALQATGNALALKNNGQRKITRLPNGDLYSAYESAGKIWVEKKPNGGAWQLLLEPLYADSAKYPSLAVYGSKLLCAYQRKYINGQYILTIGVIENDNLVGEVEVAAVSQWYSQHNSTPVIASTQEGKVLVVWRQEAFGSNSAGLYYRFGQYESGAFVWKTSATKLPDASGVDASAINPTLGAENTTFAPNTGFYRFHLAFQSGSHIYYRMLQQRPNGVFEYISSTSINISSSCGYSSNYQPSIISFDGGARLAWFGRKWQAADPTVALEKSSAGGEGEWIYHTVFTDPSNPTYFWNWGNQVGNVSLNKATTGTDDINYVIGWSENNGAQSRYIRNTNFTSPATFLNASSQTMTGNGDLQVTNGGSLTTMYGYFLQSGTPNKFAQSLDLSGTASKRETAPIYSGREGIVRKDSAQFYFAFGDILVNGEPVRFVPIPDTLNCDSLEAVNIYLTSENFALTDGAAFSYSVMYGITDSAAAVAALQNGRKVTFRVELVDAGTGQIIGVHDEIEFSGSNVFQYDNIGYEVNTEGLGSRNVKLRLQVFADAESHYSISDRYDEQEALGKQSAKRTSISFKGSYVITEYALDQNYPNPFNPTTTISYALPKEGMVTIKINDALGREVKTLVNEFKQTGRFTAEFDASRLASGVYIYKLVSGEYTAVKKMMLVK